MKTILIDDDQLIRLSWKRAAEIACIDLDLYASFDELMVNISKYSKDTIFYIDSQLSANERGELLALQLFNLGYQELYIASGLTFKPGELPHYIKGCISKRAPF